MNTAPEAIPAINERQLNTMHDVFSGMPTFLLVVPDSGFDIPEAFERFTESNREVNQLVELGFLEDITSANKENLAKYTTITGRIFRMFRGTDLGRYMFAASSATEN